MTNLPLLPYLLLPGPFSFSPETMQRIISSARELQLTAPIPPSAQPLPDDGRAWQGPIAMFLPRCAAPMSSSPCGHSNNMEAPPDGSTHAAKSAGLKPDSDSS